jgi:hypothetical protein
VRVRAASAWRGRLLVCVLLLALSSLAAAQQRVGTTLLARGAATASLGDDIRVLGQGMPVYEGDVLTIGSKSFAVVELDDGTRMTLRPNTVTRLEAFAHDRGEERLWLNLFKGGLRMVTGRVTRRNPDGAKVKSGASTIGIRGTDLSVRRCTEDCGEAARAVRPARADPKGAVVVGRAVFLKGQLTGRSLFSGESRAVQLNGAVYAGDTLDTGAEAFAVLVFRDQSRVTMGANSRFQIDRHKYSAEAPEESASLMRMLKGSARVASGLITRSRPKAYKIKTTVAVLSTRGTRFDLICQGRCIGGPGAGQAPPAQAAANGLFVVTREGLLSAELDGREVDLPPVSTAFFTTSTADPRFDVPLPPAVQNILGPVPETIEVDPSIFAAEAREPAPGSLLVSVHDEGHVDVEQEDGTTLSLGKGEAAMVQAGDLVRLEGGIPAFEREDPFNFSPAVEVGEATVLESAVPDPDGSALECRL